MWFRSCDSKFSYSFVFRCKINKKLRNILIISILSYFAYTINLILHILQAILKSINSKVLSELLFSIEQFYLPQHSNFLFPFSFFSKSSPFLIFSPIGVFLARRSAIIWIKVSWAPMENCNRFESWERARKSEGGKNEIFKGKVVSCVCICAKEYG